MALSGLTPYSGPWGVPQIVHLLKRTMFGAAKADVDFFVKGTLDQALTSLLTPSPSPDPPVNDYNDKDYKDPDVPEGSTFISAPRTDNTAQGRRNYSIKGWWLDLILQQGRSVQEKMVLFLHTNLATQSIDVFSANLFYVQNSLLRSSALGNYKQLVKAMTLDPQMLYYLGGAYNFAGHPDENYARELQELFCVGKGPDSHYTESDVQAAARVLTGWRINGAGSYFDPIGHDKTDKQFSAFYGNTLIKARIGADGAHEIDDLLNMIFANAETAKFLCRKFYRYFVYHTIDAATEANVIAPLAQIMRDQNYEIKPVLRALLGSEHFFDMAYEGAVLKSPADFVLGMMREFAIPLPPASSLHDRYTLRTYYFYTMLLMEQELGDPPNVAGWKAYYQEPLYDKIWISTVTAPKRGEFSDVMLYASYSVGNYQSNIDVVAYTATLTQPSDPNALVEEVLALHYSVDVSDFFKAQLKSILLTGQISDGYWTSAWNDYIRTPYDAMKRSLVEQRLRTFYRSILQSEEYQLI